MARSTLGWAFGISVSILFLAIWGRSVVVDTDTLAESLSPLANSGIVVGFLSDWMSDELLESGADPATVEPTVDLFFNSSAIGETFDRFALEVVHAAASTDPEGAAIDMADLVQPTVPELTTGLVAMGYAVTEDSIAAVVAQFDPLVIGQPGSEPLVGLNSQTAARLGTAALLASTALLVFGAAFVWLSEDRVRATRRLLNRVAVGGLSFAVFLRVGSWVLDPEGGRASVPETLSSLAGSKWAVPLQVAFVSALLAAGIYFVRRLFRRVGVFPSPDEPPTPPSERRELLSESR